MKAKIKELLIVSGMFVFIVCGIIFHWKIFEIPSLMIEDWYFEKIWGDLRAKDAVLITIDNKTMTTFRQWPLPRIIYGWVQKNCLDAGAKFVVWDMIFSEEDRFTPKNLENFFLTFFNREYRVTTDMPTDFDGFFISYLKKGGIIGAYLTPEDTNILYKDVESGHIQAMLDPDNKIRRIALGVFSGEKIYPSLGFLAALKVLNKPDALQNGLFVGDTHIQPWQTIRFRHWTVPKIPFEDVFYNDFPKEFLQDKVVFVGPEADLLNDMKVFPWGNLPGVYAHISSFEDILHGIIKKTDTFSTLIYAFGISLALFFFLRKRDKKIYPAAFMLLTCFLLVCLYGYAAGQKTYIDPLPTILFTFIVTFSLFANQVRKEREELREMQRYMAPEVADVVIHAKKEVMAEGEIRDVTVLFSDLRGFTTLCEKLTPKQIQMLLNAIMTPMSETVRKYEGIVDKYVGDEIMAVFNAPVLIRDHPKKCLDAAFEMLHTLANVEHSLPKDLPSGINLRCGIGINSGNAFVGDMGGGKTYSYTCLGTTVNLASRVEHLCSAYNEELLVSENFRNRFTTWSMYRFLLVDIVKIKGIELPQFVYKPIVFDNGSEDAVVAVDNWNLMEIALRENNVQRAWELGETALKTGFFRTLYDQKRENTPFELFLENIVGKNKMLQNGS